MINIILYYETQHKILNINISYIFLFTKRITQACIVA